MLLLAAACSGTDRSESAAVDSRATPDSASDPGATTLSDPGAPDLPDAAPRDSAEAPEVKGPEKRAFTMEQTLSDGAQRTTLAFAGLAMMTGNLEAQSFFPPGKVADYTGFQYLRDNDPDGMGHNTSFLSRIACNVIFILDDAQLDELKSLAVDQMPTLEQYALGRFPLMKAFRRQLEGDLPAGSEGLNLESVVQASRDLYVLDGRISFERARLYTDVLASLDAEQRAYLDDMLGKGWRSWPDVKKDQVKGRLSGLKKGTNVAVMTYAGDLFSWYAGSVEADVYFCPERHGTYFGAFYIKDAPAMGRQGYNIDEELTATAGSALCDEKKGYVTREQAREMKRLVDAQRENLYAGDESIVSLRTESGSAALSGMSRVHGRRRQRRARRAERRPRLLHHAR